MSDSVWPHRQQPTRLLCPWNSPAKNTGVSCHFLLQCMKVKSEREVAQSCLTLCDPMDCSPPGSSLHGILQARVLEWSAIAFSDILYSDYYFIFKTDTYTLFCFWSILLEMYKLFLIIYIFIDILFYFLVFSFIDSAPLSYIIWPLSLDLICFVFYRRYLNYLFKTIVLFWLEYPILLMSI